MMGSSNGLTKGLKMHVGMLATIALVCIASIQQGISNLDSP
jgi:hypothetical protein